MLVGCLSGTRVYGKIGDSWKVYEARKVLLRVPPRGARGPCPPSQPIATPQHYSFCLMLQSPRGDPSFMIWQPRLASSLRDAYGNADPVTPPLAAFLASLTHAPATRNHIANHPYILGFTGHTIMKLNEVSLPRLWYRENKEPLSFRRCCIRLWSRLQASLRILSATLGIMLMACDVFVMLVE